MLKQKRGESGKSGDHKKKGSWNKMWAPPQPHEQSKRTIKGNAMWYNKNTKRWVPDKDAKQANLAGNPPTPVHIVPPDPATPDPVQLATQLKKLQATFTSFKEQMLLDDN
jgi:hypothetical protein